MSDTRALAMISSQVMRSRSILLARSAGDLAMSRSNTSCGRRYSMPLVRKKQNRDVS